ncbi:unnamed protein product, partial [Scytosiphon promiscuus]
VEEVKVEEKQEAEAGGVEKEPGEDGRDVSKDGSPEVPETEDEGAGNAVASYPGGPKGKTIERTAEDRAEREANLDRMAQENLVGPLGSKVEVAVTDAREALEAAGLLPPEAPETREEVEQKAAKNEDEVEAGKETSPEETAERVAAGDEHGKEKEEGGAEAEQEAGEETGEETEDESKVEVE